MSLKTRSRLVLPMVVALAVLLPACARATPAPTPPAATPSPAAATEGQRLYAQKCAACHGPNAEGTAAAPAIAGHGVPGLKTQVRNPVGAMPAFPPGQLSDHDLGAIAEYVNSLGRATAPAKEWEKEATEVIHLWMAMLAIKFNELRDARLHLQDVLTFVKIPKHRAEIEKVLALIDQGKTSEAEHEIEEMAGAESPSGVTRQRFHLLLAQRGIEDMNAAEAKKHLERFLVRATEKEKAIVQEALELVAKGDLHEAEHEIEELLGG